MEVTHVELDKAWSCYVGLRRNIDDREMLRAVLTAVLKGIPEPTPPFDLDDRLDVMQDTLEEIRRKVLYGTP